MNALVLANVKLTTLTTVFNWFTLIRDEPCLSPTSSFQRAFASN